MKVLKEIIPGQENMERSKTILEWPEANQIQSRMNAVLDGYLPLGNKDTTVLITHH